MNNVKDILKDLKNITMLTGELSTVHEESFSKWPYIAFDGVSNVEIKYDFTKDYTNEVGEGYINFDLTISDEHCDQNLLKERGDAVTSWVRDSLWNEIKVTISFNGICKYSNSSLKAEAEVKEVKNGSK